jgi:8-amino-7-oxononanoate synthase
MSLGTWSGSLRSNLQTLKTRNLYRSPESFSSKNASKKLGHFIDFSSNDYLGLSHHPRVTAAACAAARKWGTGSAASRLLSGNLAVHGALEKKIARFKKEEEAIVFSSGYLANLGVIQALVNEKDAVILDRLNHASLIDGARLSKAKFWVYRHKDMEQLDGLLSRAKGFRRRLVVTDAYFSMDGDLAPLPELARLCKRHDAMIMIDEAHSTGVYGKTGRGIAEHFGVKEGVGVTMGTLSKALGSAGGFIAGNASLKETLVNVCRPYIYTTAPVPAASASALEALNVIEDTPSIREKLWSNIRRLREGLEPLGFDLMGSEGPIVPIRVGDPAKTTAIKEKLKAQSCFVSAIRPPSVPEGTDRIRLSVSAAHSSAQIDKLVATLKDLKGLF